MQLSAALVLATPAGVMADLHKYAVCTSRIQPINNNNVCPKKRDILQGDAVNMTSSRIMGRGYADNEAATRKACAAYKKRNTGNNQWDKCPDCTVGWRNTPDPAYCVVACNSADSHLGGDEWHYYCKQNGADGSEAY